MAPMLGGDAEDDDQLFVIPRLLFDCLKNMNRPVSFNELLEIVSDRSGCNKNNIHDTVRQLLNQAVQYGFIERYESKTSEDEDAGEVPESDKKCKGEQKKQEGQKKQYEQEDPTCSRWSTAAPPEQSSSKRARSQSRSRSRKRAFDGPSERAKKQKQAKSPKRRNKPAK